MAIVFDDADRNDYSPGDPPDIEERRAEARASMGLDSPTAMQDPEPDPAPVPATTLDRATPPARPLVRGTPPGDYGQIEIGGKSIPRTAPPATRLTSEQTALVRSGLGSMDAAPAWLGLHDWRSGEAAVAAVQAPRAESPSGSPTPFGKLAILRPAAGNFAPSAAFVFRAAQYAGKTVIAYQNTSDPAKNVLREVKTLDGAPVPPALRGKIFAIGSEEPGFAGLEQASDGFLAELGQMEKQKDLLGVDPLSSDATVFGHSEGASDAALTRRRLEDAGFGHAVGKLVTLGSGIGLGSGAATGMPPVVPVNSFGLRVLGLLGEQSGFEGMRDFPADTARLLPAGSERLIDLAVASVVGGPPGVKLRWGLPPVVLDDPNNIKPGVRSFLSGSPLIDLAEGAHLGADALGALKGSSYDSDGFVPTALSQAGKQSIVLEKPHDHLGMVEDPAVVDEIVRSLE
jgi:hypothetical protein